MVPKDEDINFMLEDVPEEQPNEEDIDLDGFVVSDSDAEYLGEDEVYDPGVDSEEEEDIDMEPTQDDVHILPAAEDPGMVSAYSSDAEESLHGDVKATSARKGRNRDKEEMDATESSEEPVHSPAPSDANNAPPNWDDILPSDAEDEGVFDYPEQPQHYKVRTDLRPDQYTVYPSPLVCV